MGQGHGLVYRPLTTTKNRRVPPEQVQATGWSRILEPTALLEARFGGGPGIPEWKKLGGRGSLG